jgi:RNA 2',3'-cyclic 3'-phosphodiesterase
MRVARSEPEAREPHRRLFFALWPQDAFQVTLADATRSAVVGWGGRAVPPENFHITLAFLGSVPQRRLAEVVAIAGQVADEIDRPPLQLAFDGIEYWKKAQVVCATASATPPAAIELADALKSQLTAAGFAPDLKPFRAHVTLARKVPRGSHEGTMRTVLWRFTEFALVDSRTGPEGALYSVLNSWPLCTEVRKMPEKKHK